MAERAFRVGILGGMGPEAGVLLQGLIVQATPATCDQEHLEVVTFTSPRIPDRTRSLAEDGGALYVAAVIESLRLLERMEPDIMVMACNTAHARLADVRAGVATPMLDMVGLAREAMEQLPGRVAILATDGTVRSGLFAPAGGSEKATAPPPEMQRIVMDVIGAVKAGANAEEAAAQLTPVVAFVLESGCDSVLLGCTELSVCHDELVVRFGDIFIDPLRLAAMRLVALAHGASS